MLQDLRGIIPALATPLRADGSVDTDGMARLVDYVVDGGVRGLFVLSSTGEGPMLREEDKEAAVRAAVEAAAGRVAILVHIADTSTARVIRQAEKAAEWGADYVVSTLPFYFRHSGAQAMSFYTDVAEASPRPLMLYNVPHCTGVQVTAEEIAELAAHPNIVGIKDSTQDWRHFQQVIRVKQSVPEFLVFNGDEEALASTVLMGGDGGVLGLANVAPRLCVDVFEAADRGDIAKARELQARLAELQDIWLMAECSHGGLKLALSVLGICEPYVTRPLIPPSPDLEPRMLRLLREHGLL